jgi:hypothetical protein
LAGICLDEELAEVFPQNEKFLAVLETAFEVVVNHLG